MNQVNITEEEVFDILKLEFAIDKNFLKDLDIRRKAMLNYFDNQQTLTKFVEERYQSLFERGLIENPYDSKEINLRASCGWIFARGVLKATISMGACFGGPIACGFGVAGAIVEVVESTVEICNTCGCD